MFFYWRSVGSLAVKWQWILLIWFDFIVWTDNNVGCGEICSLWDGIWPVLGGKMIPYGRGLYRVSQKANATLDNLWAVRKGHSHDDVCRRHLQFLTIASILTDNMFNFKLQQICTTSSSKSSHQLLLNASCDRLECLCF